MSEFCGAEDGGDPECFFRAPLERQVGWHVGAAVEVLLAAGEAQVQPLVTECGIFITLMKDGHRKELLKFGKMGKNSQQNDLYRNFMNQSSECFGLFMCFIVVCCALQVVVSVVCH